MRRFLADRSGQVLVITALLVPVIAGMGAIAVDVSSFYVAKNQLQAAADAAALGAARWLDDKPKATELAIDLAAKNVPANAGTVTKEEDVVFGVFDAANKTFTPTNSSPNAVRVTAMRTAERGNAAPTFLGKLLGSQSADISAYAIAAYASGTPYCVQLLEPTQIGLSINSNSHLKASCGVYVNSSNKEGIYVNSGSSITAADVCVTGNYRLNSGSTSTPTPKTGCPPKPDPLAHLPEPAYGGCDYTDLVIQSNKTQTLNPGVYCKKLEIQSNATVYFNPGPYIFPDSELIVNSNGRLIGDGVTLYFNKEHGRLNANSNSMVHLKAPSSGTYKGVVMFQSRAKSSLSAPPHIINSHSSSYFEGTIYVPKGKLMINSASTMNETATYTLLIARTMEINSASTFVTNANYNGATPLPDGLMMSSSPTVSLVE